MLVCAAQLLSSSCSQVSCEDAAGHCPQACDQVAWLWGELLPQITGLKLEDVGPGLMHHLCFTRLISKLAPLITLGLVCGDFLMVRRDALQWQMLFN